MKISGFTMGKNVSKLYYPIKAAIESILPICDEFVVALGDSDEDDTTREEILSIGSDKIRIIDTVWDIEKYSRGTENAHQTDIAREACTGDWLFYVQADEVVHEKFLPVVKENCEKFLDDEEVEGFLFNYKHFWGDYHHYFKSRSWYGQEIRVIRNKPDIHSFWSAQSFRRIPDFDYVDYREKKGTYKLKVVEIEAEIYHYGWVRPPELMTKKRKSLTTIHTSKDEADKIYQTEEPDFDYGPLNLAKKFDGTHPAVLQEWMAKFDWADQLDKDGSRGPGTHKFKHAKLKYKFVEWLEDTFNGGKQIVGYSNWKKLRR